MQIKKVQARNESSHRIKIINFGLFTTKRIAAGRMNRKEWWNENK